MEETKHAIDFQRDGLIVQYVAWWWAQPDASLHLDVFRSEHPGLYQEIHDLFTGGRNAAENNELQLASKLQSDLEGRDEVIKRMQADLDKQQKEINNLKKKLSNESKKTNPPEGKTTASTQGGGPSEEKTVSTEEEKSSANLFNAP
jgi:hypothetical protein